MEFGLQAPTQELLDKLAFLPHNCRNYIDVHRGLETFNPDKAESYYLYTGRGPSNGTFHLGHIPGLELILEFQQFVKNKIFLMISDDEKMFRDGITQDVMTANVQNTLKNLHLLGFSEHNTDFNINSKGISESYYKIMIQLMNLVSVHQISKIFGSPKNVGEYFYTLYQIMPCFIYPEKTCIVIAGVDQDPFFRLARDLARRINQTEPIIIYTKTVPGLDGSPKMSTSVPNSMPIFIHDTESQIRTKIKKITQVGAGTLDELFEKGAELDRDVPYQLIKLFDSDPKNIELLAQAYTNGLYSETDIINLNQLVSAKCIMSRDGKTMITTSGMREYVIGLIMKVL